MAKPVIKTESKLDLIARNVAEIKANMATKDELHQVEFRLDSKIDSVEKRLSAKIDHLEERIEDLEIGPMGNLEKRVTVIERDVKVLKHKHG